MKSTKYRLAIIEDKPVILDALMEYFTSSPNFYLVSMAQSEEQFMANWQEQRIDLLLCDSSLPEGSSIEITWKVKRRSSSTQVVIFTVFEDQDVLFRSLCAGASDYVLKNCPLPEIEQQLLEVLKGGSMMSVQVARLILNHFKSLAAGADHLGAERLTPREFEIVSLLQKGDSYRQVAGKLSISVGTVKFHIRNVYGKLQLNSRLELNTKYKRSV